MNKHSEISQNAFNEVEFPGSDEYDIVTGHELALASEKSSESKSDENTTPESIADVSFSSHSSSLRHYEEEWNHLYGKDELDLEELKQRAVEGRLRTNRFRSVCWRCLLGVLHREPKQWIYQLRTYRKHYGDLRGELERNPWNIKQENPCDNPLSQESESIWQKYFSDEELKAVIHQDVIRTFPGVDFFRKDPIQDMMVRILFCYARQNPALCYRQGMHEILAPLVFILHCDHQALLHAKEQNHDTGTISEILDPAFIEQDAYTIFKFIMNHIECSYRINQMVPTSSGYFPNETEGCENKANANEVVTRLEYIRENLLKPSDPDLTKHLDQLDIPLQLFGIRWLRLLFGREFPLQDLLVLWDAIFADDNFDLVNYIVVSMLIAIRSQLLQGDYTTCLTSLMRYPPGVDISFVIEHALHLRDPQKHPPPAVTSFPNIPVVKVPKNSRKSYIRQNFEALDINVHRGRNRRLKGTPTRPAQWLQPKTRSLAIGRSGDSDGSIVDGYALDDPHLLKAELEQAHAVMSLVRLKLSQYHSVLTNNLPQPICNDAQQALDGLFELSYLLNSHQNVPNTEIEPAFEAGEVKPTKSQSHRPKKQSNENLKPSATSINSEKSHTLPKINKKPVSGELTVFKKTLGEPIKGAPMRDPLRLIKNLRHNDEDLYDLLKDINKPSSSEC